MRVAIIGAGIIGAAIARTLARRGAGVSVFERRNVGGGATQASAGALVPYVEAHEDNPLQRLTARSLGLYDEFIEAVQRESDTRLDYKRCGSLELAFSEREEQELQALAARLGERDAQWLDAAQAHRMEPALSAQIRGALLVPTHGYVSAAQLTASLISAATSAGAHVLFEDVVAVRSKAAGAAVVGGTGTAHDFDAVIIASGAWASRLTVDGQPAAPVRPVKGELLRIRGPQLQRLVWSSHCYLVPQGNGDLLIGATMEEAGFDEEKTVAARERLWAAAASVLDMRYATLLDARVGLRPATPDHLPIVGYAKTANSIVYAVGHFRNGVIMAPLTAHLVAGLLLDGRVDPALTALSPARFGL